MCWCGAGGVLTRADPCWCVLTPAADGGWEGNPANAGQIHWAETLNHGVLPNPSLPSGFVATAHDIGDPWNEQVCAPLLCYYPRAHSKMRTMTANVGVIVYSAQSDCSCDRDIGDP